jgi:vancomycin resistance protein YoaR
MSDPSVPTVSVLDGGASQPSAPPRRRRRWLWALALVVPLVLVGGLYLAAWLYAGSTVPRGTTVLGIDIGGQTPQQAEQTLTEQLPDVADAPLTLLVQDETFAIVPSESGLNIDVSATVEQADPDATDPVALLDVIMTGGRPVDPVVVVDDDRLQSTIADIAAQTDRETVDGAVAFRAGEVVVTEPVVGRTLDEAASVDLVASSYLRTSGPLDLAVEEQPPLVTAQAVAQARADFADPAMSAPVTLRSDLGTAELSPQQLSRVLSMRPGDDGLLSPRIDEKALLRISEAQVDSLGRPAQDASVSLQGGRGVVVPSQTGLTPVTDDFGDDVLAAAAATGAQRSVELPLVESQPSFTTEQARTSGVQQVVAEFTTFFPYAEYRNINIGRAAELANNTFLQPGDVFSMNDVVGERTEARGFTTGFIIDNGRFQEGVGGGVSQLATTLYNAAHFAGFTDVEHHPHSFYIDRYPMGREATVAWGSWDLRFANNTPYGAVVESFIRPATPTSSGEVTVRIWSTPYWQVTSQIGQPFNYTAFGSQTVAGPGCVPSEGLQGFDVVVTRTLAREGRVQDREEVFTRYQPTPQVTCT